MNKNVRKENGSIRDCEKREKKRECKGKEGQKEREVRKQQGNIRGIQERIINEQENKERRNERKKRENRRKLIEECWKRGKEGNRGNTRGIKRKGQRRIRR